MGLGEEELLVRLIIPLISKMLMGSLLKVQSGWFASGSHAGCCSNLGVVEYT